MKVKKWAKAKSQDYLDDYAKLCKGNLSEEKEEFKSAIREIMRRFHTIIDNMPDDVKG